jgi:hypothetical protein
VLSPIKVRRTGISPNAPGVSVLRTSTPVTILFHALTDVATTFRPFGSDRVVRQEY